MKRIAPLKKLFAVLLRKRDSDPQGGGEGAVVWGLVLI